MLQVFSKMDKASMMSRIISIAGPLMGQSAAKGACSMLYAACAPDAWGELCIRTLSSRQGMPPTGCRMTTCMCAGGSYYGPGFMNRNNTAQRVPKNAYAREPANWERAYDTTLRLIAEKSSAA